jgi:hypothetical protein
MQAMEGHLHIPLYFLSLVKENVLNNYLKNLLKYSLRNSNPDKIGPKVSLASWVIKHNLTDIPIS